MEERKPQGGYGVLESQVVAKFTGTAKALPNKHIHFIIMVSIGDI